MTLSASWTQGLMTQLVGVRFPLKPTFSVTFKKSPIYIHILYTYILYIYIYIYCIYYIYYILYIYYISYIYIKLKFQMSSARYHNWRSGLCTWKLLSKCKNIWRCSAPSFVYIEKGFKTRVVFRILPNIYRGALFRLKHITYND